MHLSLIALLLPGVSWQPLGDELLWKQPLILANALLLLSTLNLSSRTSPLLDVMADGAKLWQILTGKLSADALHQSFFMTWGLLALLDDDPETALPYYEEGCRLNPGSSVLRTNRAICLGALGRQAEAIQILREQLKEWDDPEEIKKAGRANRNLLAPDVHRVAIRSALAYYLVSADAPLREPLSRARAGRRKPS